MFIDKLRYARNSLRYKIIFYSIILMSLSLVLTSITTHTISNRIIKNKAEIINGMLTNAAVERTNTFLAELANIINLSLRNDNLDNIIGRTNTTTMSYYNATIKYEEYLRNFILHYDKIDGLAVVSSDNVVSVYNSGIYYKDSILKAYYNEIAQVDTVLTKDRFLLERYVDGRIERIAVARPIYDDGGKKVSACIVIILSSKFSQELQFAGKNIYLMDHRGIYASVNGKEYKPGLPSRLLGKNEGVDKSDLIFKGWKIINVSLIEEVYRDFSNNKVYCFAFGAIYLLIATIGVILASKKLVAPIVMLNEKIKNAYSPDHPEGRIITGKNRIGFRSRLVLFFSLLVIVPVLIITVGYYFRTKAFIENRVGSIFKYNTDLLAQQIESILSKNYRIGVEIMARDEVQDFLYHGGKANFNETQLSADIINDKAAGQSVLNISIFDNNRSLLYSSFYSKYFLEEKNYKRDMKKIDTSFLPLWKGFQESDFNKGYFTVALNVRGTSDNVPAGKKLGYIFVEFNAEELVKSLKEFTRSSNTGIYILDADDKEMLKVYNEKKTDFARYIPNKNEMNVNGQRIKIENSNYMLMQRKLGVNNWDMLVLVSIEEYIRENHSILIYSIILIAILIALSFLFSYSFSLVLGRNIDSLITVVRFVKQGDLDQRFVRRTGDEIEELGNSFNGMLDRLNLLIEEKLISEVKIKDAEIKAKEYELNLLQAQINPHFLYNTLKTVQYMVHCSDSRAEKMVKLLINLFRTGISKGERLVKLEEELEHIKTYIDIQQIRFSDKFNVIYNIPKDILQLYVLKLTLQPIVENAIYHGLELRMDGGVLRIDARKIKNCLKIVISDNGAGMSGEKLTELNELLQGRLKSKSIGISNVHERIQLRFGKEYGIKIESKRNNGTKVSLYFPIIADPQEQVS